MTLSYLMCYQISNALCSEMLARIEMTLSVLVQTDAKRILIDVALAKLPISDSSTMDGYQTCTKANTSICTKRARARINVDKPATKI